MMIGFSHFFCWGMPEVRGPARQGISEALCTIGGGQLRQKGFGVAIDRKRTRLNSSHTVISYAVFCLKKKKHTSELQSHSDLVCRLLLEKKKISLNPHSSRTLC